MDKGQFITLRPEALALRKHIAYYYFHEKQSGEPVRFVFYPHTRCGLTIYKNSKTASEGNWAMTTPDPTVDYTHLYTGIIDYAVNVKITPPFRKIGIAFHPLGINHFIDRPLSELMQQQSPQFTYFKKLMHTTLEEVYEKKTQQEKVKLLDDFFLKHKRHLNEPRIVKAMDIINSVEKRLSVHDLATALSISRKTLLRLFRLHLNSSVSNYLQVMQFRRAITTYQSAKEPLHLSTVAHMNDYYDQSDFIKHFKKITGFNPKKFFNGIEHIGNEDTFWTFKEG